MMDTMETQGRSRGLSPYLFAEDQTGFLQSGVARPDILMHKDLKSLWQKVIVLKCKTSYETTCEGGVVSSAADLLYIYI